MTIEEYKSQIFKYGGESEPWYIKDVWPEISRRNRREIERLVKKGNNPDILDYL